MHPDPLRVWAQALPLTFEPLIHQGDLALPSASDPAILEHLRLRARGRSLRACEDAARAAFGATASVLDHLVAWSADLFEDYGDALRLRDATPTDGHALIGADGHSGGADAVAIEHFRWVSLALPADILVAAFPTTHGAPAPLDIAPVAVARLLREKPVASVHQHLSAACSFSSLWSSVLSSPELVKPATGSPSRDGDAVPLGSRRNLAIWLARAGVARLVLASALAEDATTDHQLLAHVARWTEATAAFLTPNARTDTTLTLRHSLAALAAPWHYSAGASEPAGDISQLHRALVGARPSTQATDGDPMLRWAAPRLFSSHAAGADVDEQALLAHAFSAVRAGRAGPAFQTLLLQLLRVRTLLFRWLVMEPGTSGLGWFTRHFDRLSALGMAEITARQAHRLTEGTGPTRIRLSSLEVRRTGKRAGVETLIDELAQIARETDGLETGLVVHLLKVDADPDPRSARNQSALPIRYGAWLLANTSMLDELGSSLAADPRRLLHLRGIDVANDELAVPTWCVAALFRHARRVTAPAAAQLRIRAPERAVPGLRASAHGGEDFRSLHEGLRRIDELIRSQAIQRSDRIGHALAVGHDPARWAADAARTLQPRDERIADLAWELGLYASGRLAARAGRDSRARRMLSDLLACGGRVRAGATAIDEVITLHDALLAWSPPLARMSRADQLVHLERTLPPMASAFLSSPPLDDLVEVPVGDDDVAFLEDARELVLGTLAQYGITIEMNPSSNLIIADLPGLERHPARLFRGASAGGSGVRVAVADDDPITFATCLRDEYVYAYAHLRRCGCSVEDALRWLEDAMQAGMAARFTMAAPTQTASPSHPSSK